ncbi:MAG: hypothetical protein RSE56_03170 [Bacilli bacterium]|uniref:PTS sugar transporter subunit IIA n=1 Tax=Anaerorhabdus sp. TaxID=1872524 RepID=UPI002FC5F81B
MKKILIASHGNFASGIKSSINVLFGNSDIITVIDAYMDKRSVKEMIDEFYLTVKEDDQVILMSDLYGGSVNQEMFRYLEKKNTFLISGINLALVLEIAVDPQIVTKERIQEVLEEAKKAMVLVEDIELDSSNDEDFF